MTPADLIARHKGFTPGPWETQESPNGGLLLIRGNHSDRFKRHPQTHLQIVPEADARLIADAPLMLAALTAQAERIGSLQKMLSDESRDARSIAHSLEVACDLLHEAVALFRESLVEGGVDCGFDDRLADFWVRYNKFDPATHDAVAALAAEDRHD